MAERDATYAIVDPARRVGVAWQHEAAASIVRISNGYPAHLQQFAHTVWTTAAGPHVITVGDVARALPLVERDLDRRTLGPRWERMSDRQVEYLAALSLHGGRTTTRVLAATLGRTPQDLSWIRQDLVDEGDVCSPKRGHLALAVPAHRSCWRTTRRRGRTPRPGSYRSLRCARERSRPSPLDRCPRSTVEAASTGDRPPPG